MWPRGIWQQSGFQFLYHFAQLFSVPGEGQSEFNQQKDAEKLHSHLPFASPCKVDGQTVPVSELA
jgi:hypothetical protein